MPLRNYYFARHLRFYQARAKFWGYLIWADLVIEEAGLKLVRFYRTRAKLWGHLAWADFVIEVSLKLVRFYQARAKLWGHLAWADLVIEEAGWKLAEFEVHLKYFPE
jgi:hypothetical protein